MHYGRWGHCALGNDPRSLGNGSYALANLSCALDNGPHALVNGPHALVNGLHPHYRLHFSLIIFPVLVKIQKQLYMYLILDML